ncbi:hypothetical protein [Shewanella loihica]|uniref:Uncharacterized protein n=1 Tax=Shewanella loihica (strain ATCC BAA-1088 / PV-4) TaxID=323850 RepID=A3QAH5_SHELP|nr:hypothetical protein [Shewanella loihica]ABO22473.1 hypothetical protein Shew_0601 [Shewanella loihica PV-4]
MDKLKKGNLFTRTEIQQLVGGEIQTYLPQKNKVILAGCFNRKLNPDCPTEVQAGNAKKVTQKAALLISQPNTIFPVFTKGSDTDKHYEFIGMYRCTGGTNAPKVLAQAEKKSGRIDQLSYVFQLENVT